MPVLSMLAYEAYFDALAPLKTTSDAWKSIMAGLVVLRLVDDWLGSGSLAIAENPANVHAARDAVARMPESDPLRPPLCDLIDIVAQSEQSTVQAVAATMLDYGRLLQFADRWTLARDVFVSLLKWSSIKRDQQTVARTARRLGLVLRRLDQLDASDSAYAIAVQTSSDIKQPSIFLRVRMGLALNLLDRSNFAAA